MLKTKYIFLKRLYPNDAIIFLKNNRYYLLFDEQYLLKGFKQKGILKNFKYFHINYIIIDNLEIVKREAFIDNRYTEYLYKGILVDIIKKNK